MAAETARNLRVLLIEDSENDALLMSHALRPAFEPAVTRVATAEELQAALDQPGWDVVLSDYSLPRFDALKALQALQGRRLDLPFVVVSGTIGEERAAVLIKAGAHAYLHKGSLARLSAVVERELHEAESRRARQQAEARAARQAARLAALADASRAFAEAGPAYRAVLDRVVRLIADMLDGSCALRLLDERAQSLPVVAAYHPDRELVADIFAINTTPLRLDEGPAGKVVASGQTLIVPVVEQAQLLGSLPARFHEHLQRYRVYSMIVAPLIVHGFVVGTINISSHAPGKQYSLDDQQFVEELCGRAALAVENARLYESMQHARAEAELINAIAAAAAGEAEVEQILSVALDHLQHVIAFAGGSIALLEGDTLIVRAARGPFAAQALGQALDPGQSRSWQAAQAGQPFHSNDLPADGLTPTTPIRSYLAVPLTTRGRTFGMLEVDSPVPHAFREQDRDLLLRVATVLSGSIELAERYAAETQAASRLARLQALTSALSEALTPAQVIEVALNAGAATLGAAAGGLSLVSEDGHWLELASAVGYQADRQNRFRRYPIALTMPGSDAARTGEPVWLESNADWDSRYPDIAPPRNESEFQALAVLPLRAEQRTLGILAYSFKRPRRFLPDDRAYLQILARQCAQALERARLYEAEQTARIEVTRLNAELEQRVIERTAELETSREQLRALSVRLQAVREEERTRIARELHDELGQQLSALKMDLSSIRRGLRPDQAQQLERANDMAALLNTTIEAIRRITMDLRPAVLDDFGLLAAIQQQVQEFQSRQGIACRLVTTVEAIETTPDGATAIYRALQEALTNVARHARATEVQVRLDVTDDTLVLQVVDNGRGIATSELHNARSLGLVGMRERILALAGEATVRRAVEHGTEVLIRIPLTQLRPDPAAPASVTLYPPSPHP
jgi:signal transduction histidine kinase/DNA-binding NarL/FixJ family response regulator